MRVYWKSDHGRDPFIERLLTAWDRELATFERALGNAELPYIFGERVNVGHLALAARKTGAYPWYEPPSPYRDGRPDLVISRPQEPTYWFEAKWIPPDRSKNKAPRELAAMAAVKLGEARRQAQRRRWDLEDQDAVVAIVFGVLAVDKHTSQRFEAKAYRDLARDVVVRSKHAQFGAMHLCPAKIWRSGEHFNPGVLLFGSYVRTPSDVDNVAA